MNQAPDVRRTIPDLFDWVEDLPNLFPWPSPLAGQRTFRLEERIDDDKYVVRAELPGIDPDRDVSVEVEDDRLTIRAERRDERQEEGRSEFHYGRFQRRTLLPKGADGSKASATYEAGILEVTVPIVETPAASKRIPVKTS
ncbi:Hsp20/alpha crystallin family protein [Haloactinopolyspora sp.]|uniref:Hsp20/alpha crystallin family protein n=1 Tax=Haloactinopolyspora sp. TaxID=1966353 RepID=UPI00261BE0EB|nr:Hsp20/alpha crystallin family protein [Haloactinopolyspora sp.]